ncbi:MAG: cytochrome C oxidase subunit IV family protein [Chloroflexota bacterium]
MNAKVTRSGAASRPLTYLIVFLILALLTAVELFVAGAGLPRSVTRPAFLLFSLSKATLVAAFYMHLRSDSSLYRIILAAPALMVAGLGALMLIH